MMTSRWTAEETARLDRLLATKGFVGKRDFVLFPGRTASSIYRKAGERKRQVKLRSVIGGRPRKRLLAYPVSSQSKLDRASVGAPAALFKIGRERFMFLPVGMPDVTLFGGNPA